MSDTLEDLLDLLLPAWWSHLVILTFSTGWTALIVWLFRPYSDFLIFGTHQDKSSIGRSHNVDILQLLCCTVQFCENLLHNLITTRFVASLYLSLTLWEWY